MVPRSESGTDKTGGDTAKRGGSLRREQTIAGIVADSRVTARGVPMDNNQTAEQHVVEVNGVVHSQHVYFADALKTALLLRYATPEAKIRVRDLSLERQEASGIAA
jgi:hypothetical protein